MNGLIIREHLCSPPRCLMGSILLILFLAFGAMYFVLFVFVLCHVPTVAYISEFPKLLPPLVFLNVYLQRAPHAVIYNYGLHEKLISIIITLRKGYFPEVRRTEGK